MGRYVPAEKLIAEIKRLQCEQGFDTGEAERAYQFAIKDILASIDSLQQEQPHFADASKMEQLKVDSLREWSMRFAPDIRDAIEATAYHFWNLAINARKEK